MQPERGEPVCVASRSLILSLDLIPYYQCRQIIRDTLYPPDSPPLTPCGCVPPAGILIAEG